MDELLCPCEVVIPIDYNPVKKGAKPREVEPEVLTEITQWFHRQFGSVSMYGGPVQPAGHGLWDGYLDRIMRVRVALPERRTPEFVALVHAIGKKLKQKAMYYEIGPPTARIMLIEEDEGRAAVGGEK